MDAANFPPPKERVWNSDCGLSRHDRNAVRCKACGRALKIPDEGSV